jgi:hypothetical protein
MTLRSVTSMDSTIFTIPVRWKLSLSISAFRPQHIDRKDLLVTLATEPLLMIRLIMNFNLNVTFHDDIPPLSTPNCTDCLFNFGLATATVNSRHIRHIVCTPSLRTSTDNQVFSIPRSGKGMFRLPCVATCFVPAGYVFKLFKILFRQMASLCVVHGCEYEPTVLAHAGPRQSRTLALCLFLRRLEAVSNTRFSAGFPGDTCRS